MVFGKTVHWTKKAAIAVAVLIFWWLLLNAITPIVNFYDIREWYNDNLENERQNCLDMTALAYFVYFPLYYRIRMLTIGDKFQIGNDNKVRFLLSWIHEDGLGIAEDGNTTPKTLCETLVPSYKPTTRTDWPSDEESWRSLIKSWTGYRSGPWTYDDQIWTAQTDNFLYHNWGIPAGSALVGAFVTAGAIEEKPEGYDPAYWQKDFMKPLLGMGGQDEGNGWHGFVRALPDSATQSDIRTTVWVEQSPITMSGMPRTKKCGADSWAPITTSAVSLGGIGLMANPAAAVGLAVVGGVIGAQEAGCFD